MLWQALYLRHKNLSIMMQKRFVLAIALVTCFTGIYAQKNDDKLVKFGIRAGVNFPKLYGDSFDGSDADTKFSTGFNAGLTADLLITPEFYLQPGLLFTTKGAKTTNRNTKVTVNTSYIELPVNLIFKPELGNGRLLLGAGPYVAYGITGKSKSKTGTIAIELDAKFKNTITAADYINGDFYFVKPLDYGANILAGYELSNGLSLQLNGQLGLARVNPKLEGVTVDKTNLKNLVLGASLGYKF